MSQIKVTAAKIESNQIKSRNSFEEGNVSWGILSFLEISNLSIIPILVFVVVVVFLCPGLVLYVSRIFPTAPHILEMPG